MVWWLQAVKLSLSTPHLLAGKELGQDGHQTQCIAHARARGTDRDPLHGSGSSVQSDVCFPRYYGNCRIISNSEGGAQEWFYVLGGLPDQLAQCCHVRICFNTLNDVFPLWVFSFKAWNFLNFCAAVWSSVCLSGRHWCIYAWRLKRYVVMFSSKNLSWRASRVS